MTKTLKSLAMLLLLMGTALQLGAQNRGRMPAAVNSPVVNPDNTVTFNYRNANAKSVKVNVQFAGTHDMTKDANGVWTITLGPAAPDIYPYCFIVDGVNVMDPLNPDWFPNETFKNSLVDIRGDKPLVHSVQSVPHGSVDYVNYYSKTLGTWGRLVIYTPPFYDQNQSERYPVFYLISGTTDTEETYHKVGRTNFILDNLIAAGKAVPMIVVMPYGNPSKYFPAGTDLRGRGDMTSEDFINDIVPYVDANYRTIADREHRAVGGFSRGGNQALSHGLRHLDMFSHFCCYSSYTSMDLPAYDRPDINNLIKVFWLGVGTDDFLYEGAKQYMDFLDSKKIKNIKFFTTDKFGHTWMNAKCFLDQSVPLLFK